MCAKQKEERKSLQVGLDDESRRRDEARLSSVLDCNGPGTKQVGGTTEARKRRIFEEGKGGELRSSGAIELNTQRNMMKRTPSNPKKDLIPVSAAMQQDYCNSDSRLKTKEKLLRIHSSERREAASCSIAKSGNRPWGPWPHRLPFRGAPCRCRPPS